MQRAAAGLRRETGDAERARDDARAAAREQARPPAPIVDSDNNNNYNNNGSARRRPNLTSRGSLLLAQWLQWLTVPRAPRQAERSRAREAALRGEAEEQRAARGALLEARAPPPPLGALSPPLVCPTHVPCYKLGTTTPPLESSAMMAWGVGGGGERTGDEPPARPAPLCAQKLTVIGRCPVARLTLRRWRGATRRQRLAAREAELQGACEVWRPAAPPPRRPARRLGTLRGAVVRPVILRERSIRLLTSIRL